MEVAAFNKPHPENNRRSPFMLPARRWLHYLRHPNSGQVYIQNADLSHLPALPDIMPLSMKEMATDNEQDIEAWLQIIGESFSRSVNRADFIKAIIDHNEYLVERTYFLMRDEEPIGVVSWGIFRRNKKMGVTHYLGIKKYYSGRGLGKYLILYTLHKMRDEGITLCECESKLEHGKSLLIHFDFGFQPKERDEWNVENITPWPFNILARRRFRALYDRWQKERGSSGRS